MIMVASSTIASVAPSTSLAMDASPTTAPVDYVLISPTHESSSSVAVHSPTESSLTDESTRANCSPGSCSVDSTASLSVGFDFPLGDSATPLGQIGPMIRSNTSQRDSKIQLVIVAEPEQRHRARYLTEGSRGAVKDQSGNGFPVVQLLGYNKMTVLQVFIGSDLGRVTPHIFYQACRVSGKNSTPCTERKIDGTAVIEMLLKPDQGMTVTCDCVGILKERNVDIEHRFPEQTALTKKKSTRCRMVFRACITFEDGTSEVLQVSSAGIICTQPPGVPEILKMSHFAGSVAGGLELVILGKNFKKDTVVIFQRLNPTSTGSKDAIGWKQTVVPIKDHLQNVHLVCIVPPYYRQDITVPEFVTIYVNSSGKDSEYRDFIYTPIGIDRLLPTDRAWSLLHKQPQLVHGARNGPNGPIAVVISKVTNNVAAPTGSMFRQGPAAGTTGCLDVPGSRNADAAFDDAGTHMFMLGGASLDYSSSGLMPPPANALPAACVDQRRASLVPAGSERLYGVTPPPDTSTITFKPEQDDPECSRSTVDEDSSDHFPGSAENSLDGITFGQSTSSSSMYQRRSVRLPSMDITEDSSSNMSMKGCGPLSFANRLDNVMLN
uniref:Uncharacterized protein n=1 Tax=Anopheles atroparvus TaxID=41427 RepID=A0A182J795_ANOAO